MAAPTRYARDAHTERPNLAPTHVSQPRIRIVWAITRIALGLVFLWAFVDKLFGLGYATPVARSWLNGGSPTRGFLGGVEGPFAGMFNAIAGNVFVDWLFMIGLLGIGVALVLGIGVRIAAVAGALLMIMMWAASLPLANHPFLDDHVIYALVLGGLAFDKAGHTLGLGERWSQLDVVRRNPWLE